MPGANLQPPRRIVQPLANPQQPDCRDRAMTSGKAKSPELPRYRVLPAGDTALVVEFGTGIDRRLSALVLALARRLDEAPLNGMVETVPTLRSLMVYYDPLLLPAAVLLAHIDQIMQTLDPSERAGRSWRLPVCYDSRVAPDLEEVAARTGLGPAAVIERHSTATYHVYMLGFLPGQAYMGELPRELVLPRRETPRLQIPPGSLAIATSMTCIFPLATPCGWHVIGRCPVPLWENQPQPRALLAPGDCVNFRPVSLAEYEHLLASASEPAPPSATGTDHGAAA
jgi:KipI family sensor histidine kinase inhibitor